METLVGSNGSTTITVYDSERQWREARGQGRTIGASQLSSALAALADDGLDMVHATAVSIVAEKLGHGSEEHSVHTLAMFDIAHRIESVAALSRANWEPEDFMLWGSGILRRCDVVDVGHAIVTNPQAMPGVHASPDYLLMFDWGATGRVVSGDVVAWDSLTAEEKLLVVDRGVTEEVKSRTQFAHNRRKEEGAPVVARLQAAICARLMGVRDAEVLMVVGKGMDRTDWVLHPLDWEGESIDAVLDEAQRLANEIWRCVGEGKVPTDGKLLASGDERLIAGLMRASFREKGQGILPGRTWAPAAAYLYAKERERLWGERAARGRAGVLAECRALQSDASGKASRFDLPSSPALKGARSPYVLITSGGGQVRFQEPKGDGSMAAWSEAERAAAYRALASMGGGEVPSWMKEDRA